MEKESGENLFSEVKHMKTKMILFAAVIATLTNCSNLPSNPSKGKEILPLVEPGNTQYLPGTTTTITVPGNTVYVNVPTTDPNNFWVGNKDWNNDGGTEFTIGDITTGFMQKLNMPGPAVGVTSSAFNWNCSQIYVTANISGQDNIWKYDIATSTYGQITTDTGIGNHMIWSADSTGRYFLYNHMDTSLYVYDTVLNTSTLVHTFTGYGAVMYASWKDSSTLIVSLFPSSGSTYAALYYYNLNTQALTKVTGSSFKSEFILRQDGSDYYVVGDDTGYSQKLYHSTDLVNFTLISNNARYLINHPGDGKVYYSEIASSPVPQYPWTVYSFTTGTETAVFPSGNSIGVHDFCRGFSATNIP